MDKWKMVLTDHVDNIHMLFPNYWYYEYKFYVVASVFENPNGTVKHDMPLPMNSKITEFLTPFDELKYSLHTEWATNKLGNVDLFDVLHYCGTNNTELATLFKLTWC